MISKRDQESLSKMIKHLDMTINTSEGMLIDAFGIRKEEIIENIINMIQIKISTLRG